MKKSAAGAFQVLRGKAPDAKGPSAEQETDDPVSPSNMQLLIVREEGNHEERHWRWKDSD